MAKYNLNPLRKKGADDATERPYPITSNKLPLYTPNLETLSVASPQLQTLANIMEHVKPVKPRADFH